MLCRIKRDDSKKSIDADQSIAGGEQEEIDLTARDLKAKRNLAKQQKCDIRRCDLMSPAGVWLYEIGKIAIAYKMTNPPGRA